MGEFRGGKYGLQYRTKEERHEIAMKSVETRKKKRAEKMMLQKCMRELLTMPVIGKGNREVLEKFGYEDEEQNNKTLLMIALFKKGLSGDVQAIKEITNMMEKLDMFNESGKVNNNVMINIIPTGEQYVPTEEDEKEILKAENDEPFDEEENTDEWDIDSETDWGEEVYTP